jgi:drug/metabolite transporter (DMT)-like permease
MTAIPLAFFAALLFALGSALQRRGGRVVWLLGMGADAAGYLGQAAALAVGRLAVVQPLLASSLIFALPLGAAFDRRRVTRGELLAALAVAGGLALFLIGAQPSGGGEDASTGAWLIAFATCGAVCLLCRRGAVRLGAATGVLFGLSAALTKATVERLDDGIVHALLDWHVLALALVGALSVVLAQASLRAGSLGTAVAAQMSFDAITSLLIGIFAFGERVHASDLTGAFALAGVTLALGGIAALAADRAQVPG